MNNKNISEKLPKKITLFELIKTKYPEIDGMFKANFEGQKHTVDLALKSKFSDEERLGLLDELRRELSPQIHHLAYNTFYQLGDVEIEIKENMTLNDIFKGLPEPFVSLVNILPTATKIDTNFKANPNLSETLLSVFNQKDKELNELDISLIGYLDSFANSNMPEIVRQPFKSLRANFDKDSSHITVDEQLDTFTALLSKLYYQRESFKHICSLYDNLKWKLENGNIGENDSKPYLRNKQTNEVNLNDQTTSKRKILFLTANPKQTRPLRVDKECRKVKDGLNAATNREDFEFISASAVMITTITRAMQVHNPQIIHFSGHGTKTEGIAVEDENGQVILFPTEGLDRLFKSFKGIVKCVVLNACHSSVQAEVISKHGIYVVGMNDAIGDEAATSFAVGFYQSLGEGKDYEFAFEMGMVSVSPYLKYADKPELWFNGQRIRN